MSAVGFGALVAAFLICLVGGVLFVVVARLIPAAKGRPVVQIAAGLIGAALPLAVTYGGPDAHWWLGYALAAALIVWRVRRAK